MSLCRLKVDLHSIRNCMEQLEVKAYVVKMTCILCLKYFNNMTKNSVLMKQVDMEVGSMTLQIEIIKYALKAISTPLLKKL